MPFPEAFAPDDSAGSQPLRVLITNRCVAARSGTELYVAELVHGLLDRGHTPILYAPRRGGLAEQLRRQSIVVLGTLADLHVPPDIIHGHHRVATMTALARFPGVPVISFAHDFTLVDDTCPVHPRVRRYVAVDDTNRDRLYYTDGVDPAQVEVRLNWFDAKRFRPRTATLPIRPRRALVFSNAAVEGSGFLPVLRAACERFGIVVDVAGIGVGRVAHAPEAMLKSYDIVFAKARAAIEAMASGCATILCDAAGFGGLVTTERVRDLRRLNFGVRSLRSGHDVELVASAIAAYDPADAAAVTDFVRRDADMEAAIDGLVGLYRMVIREALLPVAVPSLDHHNDDARAMSKVFEDISTQIIGLEDQCWSASGECSRLGGERDELVRQLSDVEDAVLREQRRVDDALAAVAVALTRAQDAEAQLQALARVHELTLASATLRMRDALVRRRWLVWLWRNVRRSSARDARREGRV